MIKQKRKEKAGKWQVPIPKVKAMTEDEMFKVRQIACVQAAIISKSADDLWTSSCIEAS